MSSAGSTSSGSKPLMKAVALRLKEYIEVKRREDGFDASGTRGRRPGFEYDSRDDENLHRYFEQPSVRRSVSRRGVRETSLQRAERVQRQAALDHEIAKEMLRDAKKKKDKEDSLVMPWQSRFNTAWQVSDETQKVSVAALRDYQDPVEELRQQRRRERVRHEIPADLKQSPVTNAGTARLMELVADVMIATEENEQRQMELRERRRPSSAPTRRPRRTQTDRYRTGRSRTPDAWTAPQGSNSGLNDTLWSPPGGRGQSTDAEVWRRSMSPDRAPMHVSPPRRVNPLTERFSRQTSFEAGMHQASSAPTSPQRAQRPQLQSTLERPIDESSLQNGSFDEEPSLQNGTLNLTARLESDTDGDSPAGLLSPSSVSAAANGGGPGPDMARPPSRDQPRLIHFFEDDGEHVVARPPPSKVIDDPLAQPASPGGTARPKTSRGKPKAAVQRVRSQGSQASPRSTSGYSSPESSSPSNGHRSARSRQSARPKSTPHPVARKQAAPTRQSPRPRSARSATHKVVSNDSGSSTPASPRPASRTRTPATHRSRSPTSTRQVQQTPPRSPVRSPARSPVRSPARSPVRSPSRDALRHTTSGEQQRRRDTAIQEALAAGVDPELLRKVVDSAVSSHIGVVLERINMLIAQQNELQHSQQYLQPLHRSQPLPHTGAAVGSLNSTAAGSAVPLHPLSAADESLLEDYFLGFKMGDRISQYMDLNNASGSAVDSAALNGSSGAHKAATKQANGGSPAARAHTSTLSTTESSERLSAPSSPDRTVPRRRSFLARVADTDVDDTELARRQAVVFRGADWLTAAREGDLNRLQELFEADPELIHDKDEAGRNALHIACGHGSADIVQFLVDSGVDMLAETHAGYTPMHFAAGSGHVHCVRLLHSYECPLSVATVDGITPMHMAAAANRIECVKFLVANRADFLAQDMNGATPYDLAERDGHVECARFLKSCVEDVKSGTGVLSQLLNSGHLATDSDYQDDSKLNDSFWGTDELPRHEQEKRAEREKRAELYDQLQSSKGGHDLLDAVRREALRDV